MIKADPTIIGKRVEFFPPDLDYEHCGFVVDISTDYTSYYVRVKNKYYGGYRCFWFSANRIRVMHAQYQYREY